MRLKTSHVRSQWFRSTLEKFFRTARLWLNNSSVAIQQTTHIMLPSSLIVWSETVYRSRCCGQAQCLVCLQIMCCKQNNNFCLLPYSCITCCFRRRKPWTLRHKWTILGIFWILCQKASSFWSGKTLCFFFHKFFPETFVATSAVFWIDVRETQQDTGRYGKKSQQELKRTRLENRKFKDLASFAVQYDQHSNALISEYYDGFRATSFKRKVRPTHCLQSADASFSRHTGLSVETATEKWCKRRRLRGQDKTIGVYLQKSKFPLQFKSSNQFKSSKASDGSHDTINLKIQTAAEVNSSLWPARYTLWCCCLQTPSNLFQVTRLWNTTSTRTIAAMRDDGQQILRIDSFRTLQGNNWLDGDVSP